MNEVVKSEKVQDFELNQRLGKMFYASGMFPDLKSEAQAMVKVMVGKELNLPPFASITGIHVVAGKPVIGANLIATMIANHPRYSYRVSKSTKEICEINFFDSKNKLSDDASFIGSCSFTAQEAQEAGLLGKDNWKKYTADMLFARAISRGAKRYAPGIFGGAAVYTPDELGVDHDEDGVLNLHSDVASIVATANVINQEKFSDEAIIEEFKQTHVINEEFR
jgi:hypothetical protein